MRQVGGALVIVDPAAPGGRIERDTMQCAHCMRHWIVEPGSGRQRGFCLSCMAPTCGLDACQTCVPFMKKIEQQEARDRLANALGLVR